MKYPNRIFGADAAPYTSHNTQQFPLGQVMELPNGKIFRYAEMGNTVGVANKLYQSEVPSSNWDTLSVVTAILGASTITATVASTAMLENDFAEGSCVVESSLGLGHCYPVKSNTAASGGDTVLTLADGVTVQVTLTATTHKVAIFKNPWKDIIIHPAPQTAIVVGIPLVVIAANAYGWVQSHGVTSCLGDGGAAPDQKLRVSESANGAVAAFDTDEGGNVEDLGEIAWNMFTTPTLDFGHVFLMVE